MIEQHLGRVLDIGTHILSTLEDETLELEKMKRLYQERGEAIHQLDHLSVTKDLNLKRKNEIESLFDKLKEQQFKLNNRLKYFASEKKEALALINTHKKAKESYSRRSADTLSNSRQIINLKQG